MTERDERSAEPAVAVNLARVAIVTGSSRGVGRTIAEYFLRRNYLVCGCGRHPSEWHDGSYEHEVLDLSDPAAGVDWIRKIERKHKRIDVLVNNAAVNHIGLTMLTGIEKMAELLNVNLVTPMALAREAARIMTAQGRGHIINVSSIAVAMQAAGTAPYVASKAALEAFGRVFAKEVGPHGVTCNTLALSYMETAMSGKVPARAKEEVFRFMTVKGAITVEDIAHVLEYVTASSGGRVNGQIVRVGF